jgi:hypothetical protein
MLLIDRLQSKGMDPALIPAFLKSLMRIVSSSPAIAAAEVNQKLNALGWTEVSIDYHFLQIAIACLEADTQSSSGYEQG